MSKKFKDQYTLEERKKMSKTITEKYKDRIPIIVEKADSCKLKDMDKKKYLVPSDLTIGQLLYVIRKRIQLSPEKALFLFVNNTIPKTSSTVVQCFTENKDEDGFLYAHICEENTFG